MKALLTGDQLRDMAGPDDPECDCEGCNTIRKIKPLLCSAVETFEAQMRAENPNLPPGWSAWMAAVQVVGSRLAVQGVNPLIASMGLQEGGDRGVAFNPLLSQPVGGRC